MSAFVLSFFNFLEQCTISDVVLPWSCNGDTSNLCAKLFVKLSDPISTDEDHSGTSDGDRHAGSRKKNDKFKS